jgi:excinuclease UvrABC helicase subunit UvrB
MNRSHTANSALPAEYRKAAERLFSRDGFSCVQKPDLKSAAEFAKSLGIGADYQRLLALEKNSAEMRTFLEHFQNNLDLLIQKTWVEKFDETRKEKLQDKIPSFMASIEQEDFLKAIEEFGTILEEMAYLFFGAQSEKEDFTEYTFRIDAQMGLFWWYGGRLSSLKEMKDKNGERDDKVLWSVLLIGLCFLTNF